MNNAELKAENTRLRTVLVSVAEIVNDAPELNMSNYHEDQVSELNDAMINACAILQQEAVASEVVEVECQNCKGSGCIDIYGMLHACNVCDGSGTVLSGKQAVEP